MSNPYVPDPNDPNYPPKPAREGLWTDVVAQYEPNWQYQQSTQAAYKFGDGSIVFYNKKNQYDDAEPMIGSEGSSGGESGWLLK